MAPPHRVRLRVKAEMRMGEAVYVVGSHPLLGEWDVKQALQLFTSPETFPMWFPVQNLVFPEGTVVEYKYMVVCGGSFQVRKPAAGVWRFAARRNAGHTHPPLACAAVRGHSRQPRHSHDGAGL